MKLQQGFSIIELMIVMAMSAIIMTCLLGIYNQVARNMQKIEQFVTSDMQLLALENRLGKDFAGLSSLWFTQEQIESKKNAEQGKQSGTAETSEKKAKSQSFYSKNKGDNLDLLTFMTTGALQSFGDNQNRFVRVVYRVEQDPKNKGMFRLMRKELANPTEAIDESALKSGTYYQLVDGITSIVMSYTLIDKAAWQEQQTDSKDKEKSSQKTDKKQQIVRSVKEWKEEPQQATKEKGGLNNATAQVTQPAEKKSEKTSTDEPDEEDLSGAAAPTFVTMTIIFGQTDRQPKHEYKLEFIISAVADTVPCLVGESKKVAGPTPTDKDLGQHNPGVQP